MKKLIGLAFLFAVVAGIGFVQNDMAKTAVELDPLPMGISAKNNI